MKRLACAVLRTMVTSGMRSSSHCSTSTFVAVTTYRTLFPSCLVLVKPWQSRSKQRYYWARHQATDNRQYHIYGQEWKYIHVQHQRVSERPTDETQHGRGAFQEWSVSGCGLWPSVHSHGETRCHILLQESVWLFPRCGKRGRCNRPCREPRRQYAGKVLSGRNLETAVSVPAQAWAVHLPISCRLRLLFERNRGNTRTTICSICVRQTAKVSIRNLQNWMVGKPLKSISRNARCAASSSTGS